MSMPRVVLGPQRTETTVGRVVDRLAPHGTVAGISAGWQEREAEDGEFNDAVGGRLRNLELHRRGERVLTRDPDLRSAHRAVQRELKELRRLYDRRLGHAMSAWMELMDAESPIARRERDEAEEAVRDLDRGHLRKVETLRRQFQERVNLWERDAVAEERGAVEQLVRESSLVAIAGGHVAVLLNRLRLFGLEPLLREKPLVCWSAGAMALASTVVLFHDRPPQGQGNAEAFENGLGILPDLVPLPHGARRLLLEDRGRVGRFAKRFGPSRCVVLDPGSELTREGDRWTSPGIRVLAVDGSVPTEQSW